MLQSVSLSALQPAAANPRRKMDRKAIEGLAASIKTDGVLHNLVVSPVGKGKKERFQIVSGSRRFEALCLLQERGELPDDFTVAVEIRDDLSKDDTLRIATVENLQRQNLTPLEEAGALAKLVHKGVTLDDVVAQTGLSVTTIKRRLALNNLCREAKAALTTGVITLSQAEALTLGSDEDQETIIEAIRSGRDLSVDYIKDNLLDERPTVALAIFPPEKYTGTMTTDLFAEDETSYFDDAEQFFALQKEAVEELRKHHEASAAWVRGLSDHDLAGLQTLLAALSFGQGNCDRLDASDSLFNRVARDLSVDMKNHWRPDAAFFGRRNREQLVGIAKECGYADGNGSLGSYKKAELTSSLVRHFVNAHGTAEPTEAQRKAREWLPEAMLFPAVDPGAPAEAEIEPDSDDEVTDED